MHKYDCNLWELLKEKEFEYGLLDRFDLAIKIVVEVAKAHKSGITHRDIKLSNFMLDSRKNVTLVDFGTKGILGSPGFMAPEQVSGDNQFQPTDVFSLGKVLVHILFKWQVGWQLLWSPKICTESIISTPFAELFDLIHRMLEVIKISIIVYRKERNKFR